MATPLVKVGYAEPILPDVTRVLACLNEKEIKFEHVNINKGKRSGHAVDLLNLQAKVSHLIDTNPTETSHSVSVQASTRVHGLAFDDGQETLFESRAICRYLVEKYANRGNRTLLGRDSLERLSIEQWLKSEEHSFDPPSWTLVLYLAYAPAMRPTQDDITMESERRLSKVLDVYDQRLADHRFLAGDEFTLADLFHLPNSYYLAKQDAFTSRENVS
ncbi:hypothetical protein Taro_050240, partial [Colocasia esculenta]|nr:hypothetical protein [Colocasia esculenta]